ncbi:MAG: hypothetical protein NE330_21485 [Lentisphaeraceae bacterium]|nr:hypothetical protein [Lentisphaeraceae bacterium]
MSQEDVRITAYILGELQGQDRIDFEKEMNANPELKEEVESFKEFSAILESGLSDEDQPQLKPEQREKILESTKPKKVIKWNLIMSAIAACLVVGLFINYRMNGSVEVSQIDREKMPLASKVSAEALEEEPVPKSLASDYAAPAMERQVKEEAQKRTSSGRRSRVMKAKKDQSISYQTENSHVPINSSRDVQVRVPKVISKWRG